MNMPILERILRGGRITNAQDPDMAKHTGTYWWGWQVRGNPNNGTIISDYQLAGQP